MLAFLALLAAAQPNRVSGQVTFNGCTPGEKDIVITAQAEQIQPPGHGSARDDHREKRAAVQRTSDPHVFTFHVDGLEHDAIYRLTPQASSCGLVKFKERLHGLVQAGQDADVQMEAYAFTTQLEIAGQRGADYVWVGADAVDLTDVTQLRNFRWRTTVPGAVAGELQLSAEPFLIPGKSRAVAAADPFTKPGCEEPSSIITKIPLQKSADWSVTPAISLGGLVAPCTGEGFCTLSGVTPAMRSLLYAGAPIYARVMPIDAAGSPLCSFQDAGFSSWTTIANVKKPSPLQPVDIPPYVARASYQPPVPEKLSALQQPGSVTYGYRVTEEHVLTGNFVADPYGTMLIYSGGAQQGQTLLVGTFFTLTMSTGGGSWLDDIGDAVSGAIDDVAWIVNKIASIYNGLKKDVIEWCADAIEFVGVPCDSECHALIETAVDSGLAAMGLPPELPDFDQLVAEGEDYLKHEMEQYLEEQGVPDFVIDASEDVVSRVVEDAKTNVPQGPPWMTWAVSDDGFRPAVMRVTVSHSPYFTGDGPNHLTVSAGPPYTPAEVDVPAKYLSTPGASVTIPVTLYPDFRILSNLVDINDPANVTYLEHTWNAYWFSYPACFGLGVESAYAGPQFNVPAGAVMDTNYSARDASSLLRPFDLNCH